MCVVCGCQSPLTPPAPLAGLAGLRFESLQAAKGVLKSNIATPSKSSAGNLHYGENPAGVSVPGLSHERCIQIETRVLSANDQIAARNRQQFAQAGVLALNLVSSPGSGKTTLLVETIRQLHRRGAQRAVVIEGDQQTTRDADRIRATGAAAVQVNTGKGCHLDAAMVEAAWAQLVPLRPDLLFIENVGNLVCPAMWDLGEAAKVAILSVTEGEDKPLKYPDMFAAAGLVLLNKTDLLPYLHYDVDAALAAVQRVNPQVEVIQLSAFGGEGFDRWIGWLEQRRILPPAVRGAS